MSGFAKRGERNGERAMLFCCSVFYKMKNEVKIKVNVKIKITSESKLTYSFRTKK